MVRQNLIATVLAALSRRVPQVYPGFVQLAAFMSMNIERHLKAHRELTTIWPKASTRSGVTKAFYDDTSPCSTCRPNLSRDRASRVPGPCPAGGQLGVSGEPVEPRAIKRTMLAHGRRRARRHLRRRPDRAAHDLCSGLRPYLKRHHMSPASALRRVPRQTAGNNQILSALKNVILASE